MGLRELNATRLKLGMPRLAWKPARAAPSTAAARVRRHRERARQGRGCLTVEVDLEALSAALVDGKFLDERHCDDRVEIARALKRALEVLITGRRRRRDANDATTRRTEARATRSEQRGEGGCPPIDDETGF
jgi:hypothetical protein